MSDILISHIYAEWDGEARVWYVSKSDIPGLATEAASVSELVEKLKRMVPELMALNGHEEGQDIPFELLARYATTAKAEALH